MKVDIRTAKLPDLVAAARAGEEVVIEEDGAEVARLVAAAPSGERPRFRLGMLDGQLGEIPDFLEPMSEEDLALWEGDGSDDPFRR